MLPFDSKSELFGALREWATSSEGYSDIAALLPTSVQATKKSSAGATSEGYVYLIKSGAYYTIGRGDELEKRVKQIRVALPDASELVHSIRTDDPPGIEAAFWHRRFADKRANGEWFKLLANEVTAFRRRKYQHGFDFDPMVG